VSASIPLFLGGSEESDNLSVTDVEVCWSTTA
jgi:hypothetical protein